MTTPPAPKKPRRTQRSQDESIVCEEDEADSPFSLYFVQILDANPKENENLENLFKACQKSGLVPEWIDEEALDRLQKSDDFFIVPCFRGKLFRKIQARKLRVFGPPILFECLEEGKALPDSRLPIYSSVFQGAKISFTNIGPEKRAQLLEKVAWMSGVISQNLQVENTHLVCGSAEISEKYKFAVANSVKLMQLEWIEDLWETSTTAMGKFSGLERNSVDCYALPVFHGFQIVLSAIDGADRMNLNQLIVDNGGQTFGNMRKTQCTHLVTENTTSQKYKKATEWGRVKIVTSRWIRKCVDLGHVIEEEKYHPKNQPLSEHIRSSTPKKDANMTVNGPDISSIHGHGGRLSFNSSAMTPMSNSQVSRNQVRFSDVQSTSSSTTVNESLRKRRSEMNLTTTLIRHPSTVIHQPLPTVHDPIDELRTQVEGLDELFENCLFLMLGVDQPEQLDKWRRFLDATGATRVSKIDSATHVVVLDPNAQEKSIIRKFLNKEDIAIVSEKWVVECVKQRALVSIDDFMWSETPAEDSQSQPALHRQFSGKTSLTSCSEAPPIANKGIFASCTFFIDFLDSLNSKSEMEKKVRENGGIIENEPERAEFVVFGATAPIQELLRFDVVVTDFWINSCIKASERLKLAEHPLFVPLPRPLSPVLQQKRVSVCSEDNELFHYVSNILKESGAKVNGVQDSRTIFVKLDDAPNLQKESRTVDISWIIASLTKNRVQPLEEHIWSKEHRFQRGDDVWMHCLRARSPTQNIQDDIRMDLDIQGAEPISENKKTSSCPLENQYFPDLRQPFKMRLNLEGVHEAINEIPSPVQPQSQESLTTSFVGRALRQAVHNTGRRNGEAEPQRRPPSVVIAENRRTVSSTPDVPSKTKRVPIMSDSLVEEHQKSVTSSHRRHFVISSTENVDELRRCIEALGGVVDKEFIPETSNILITSKLGRTPNALNMIAAGRWIVTNDYVFESVDAGKWLGEERFEWNTEMLASKGLEKDKFARQLAAVNRKWRERVQSMPVTHSVSTELRRNGAFTDWRCVVHKNDRRAGPVAPIIEAGGGHVFEISEWIEVTANRPTCVMANKAFQWNAKSAQLLKRDGIPLYSIDIVYEHLVGLGTVDERSLWHPSYQNL